jgi:hypothetical protein
MADVNILQGHYSNLLKAELPKDEVTEDKAEDKKD